MWLIFALLAPFFFAVVHVLDEYCVDEVLEKPWMGVVTSAFSSLVVYFSLPFLIPFIEWNNSSFTFIFLGLLTGLLIQSSQAFYFYALSFSQAGIVAAYWNLIPAMLPIASFFVFHKTLEIVEYAGIAVLIISSVAVCLLDYHYKTRSSTFGFMFIASLMQVVSYLLMSFLYERQDFLITFFSIITGIILTGVMPFFLQSTRRMMVKSFAKIKTKIRFFILIEIANLLALGSAQMGIKLGDASLVAAVETTMPAFTILISIPWIRHAQISGVALWNNFVPKMLIVLLMGVGVWMVS